MRIFCTILLVLFFGCLATAGETGWYSGEIVFNSEATLSGEIRYDWRADVVQYRSDGRIHTFSPHLLRSFAFFDVQLNAIRHFKALPLREATNGSARQFYEVVLTGPLQLVRRPNQIVGFGLPPTLIPAEDASFSFQLAGYDYYVHTAGRFVSINRFRREIWPVMEGEFGPELKQFMKRYGVSRRTMPGKLRLINQYNVLCGGEVLSAR